MEQACYRSGLAAIIGAPNAGKSTLLNRLLGQKIAIVSHKAQTTRNRIMGILTGEHHQLLLLDTPGLHEGKEEFNRRMVGVARESLTGADVGLLLVDASEPLERVQTRFEQYRNYLEGLHCPLVLALNKIDLTPREQALPLIAWYNQAHPFAALIPISALHGEGVAILERELIQRLPEGPQYYPEDIPTDLTERFIVAELIREQIFLLTRDEVPYASAVLIDQFDEGDGRGALRIQASILVERASQKGILIGRGGSMLAKLRLKAEASIGRLLGRQAQLRLWVKVHKNWKQDRELLHEMGLG